MKYIRHILWDHVMGETYYGVAYQHVIQYMKLNDVKREY